MDILEKLGINRDLILLTEIGVLIHDIGKLSKEFIAATVKREPKRFDHCYVLKRLVLKADPYLLPVDTNTVKALFNKIKQLLKNPKYSSVYSLLQILQTNLAAKHQLNDANLSIELRNELKSLRLNGRKLIGRQWDNLERELIALTHQWDQEIALDILPLPLVNLLNSLIWGEKLEISPNLNINLIKTLGDMIGMHHRTLHPLLGIDYPELIKVLRADHAGCDGIDSGVDKGTVSDKARQPSIDKTYIATAFGYEKDGKIDTSNLTRIRNEYANKLTTILQRILSEKTKVGNIDPKKWEEFFYRRNGIRKITEEAFNKALGETRRSANDVTLWDHSYSVASLYKSALAKILIEGKWIEPKDIKWRILRVNLDVLSIISKAHKIGDILGYKKKVEEAFCAVKKLLEIWYPLGNEVYQDESGIYFTCPDIEPEKLKELKSKIIEEIHQVEKEFSPIINVTDEPQRFLTILADEIRKAYRNIKLPIRSETAYKNWQYIWDTPPVKDTNAYRAYLEREIKCDKICYSSRPKRDPLCERLHHEKKTNLCILKNGGLYHPPIDICPVCRTRPKCMQQELCKECFERREGRVEEWLNSPKTTIWIDEVSDHNDRVAIIAGQFGLSNWLNGFYINTLFSQLLSYYNLKYNTLIEKLKNELENDDANSEFLRKIAREAYQGEKPNDFYEKRVKECDVDNLSSLVQSNEEKAKLLAMFLFRKHPSPARLRRIWKTTEKFWEEKVEEEILLKEFIYGKELENRQLELRKKRLLLEPKEIIYRLPRLAYEAKIGNSRINLYWDGEKFIIIENLQLVAEKIGAKDFIDLKKKLKGRRVIVEWKKITTQSQLIKTFTVNNVIEDENFQNYCPYIRILCSPRSFIALVPARDAFDIVKNIKKSYDEYFSKVRNRLLLFLDIVFFHRHLPLYVALDTARRMTKGHGEEKLETWEVAKIEKNNNVYKLSLKMLQKELEWEVDASLGDGNEDNFYPYFILKEASINEPLENRNYFKIMAKGENKLDFHNIVHVKDLKKGDKVEILPGYFDFVFLETTGRRFEVGLDKSENRRYHPLFGLKKSPCPYYLDEIEKFEKLWGLFKKLADTNKLTDTKLNNIQSLLANKFKKWELDKISYEDERWKKWEGFIDAVLKRNIDIDTSKLDFIKETINSGLFFDCLELYYKILKKKLKEAK